jgi:hypothetical protein
MRGRSDRCRDDAHREGTRRRTHYYELPELTSKVHRVVLSRAVEVAQINLIARHVAGLLEGATHQTTTFLVMWMVSATTLRSFVAATANR